MRKSKMKGVVITWIVILLASLAFVAWGRWQSKARYEKCRIQCAEMDAPTWSYGWHGCSCGGPTN